MREFFIECLRDLESITGIRQLFYLQSDPEGAKKKDIVISGMVEVSKKFSYISEKNQQAIIKKCIVEDQTYDALNSRVIWKWLEANKNAFGVAIEEDKPSERIIRTPEEEAKIDALIEDWKKQLASVSNVPNYSKVKEEIKRIQKEDKLRIDGETTVKDKVKSNKDHILLMKKKERAMKARGLDKVGLEGLHEYQLEGKYLWARNETEAQELYLEIYI